VSEGWASAGGLGLAVSGLAAAQVAAFLTRRVRSGEEHSGTHALLQLGVAFAAVVIASALALGALGWLSGIGFLALHVVLAAASVALDLRGQARPRWTRATRLSLARVLSPVLSGSGRLARGEPALAALLAVLLLMFGVAAATTAPLNPDSNAYRLPRIALWLEQGHLGRLGGSDPRVDYLAWNADLAMLWPVSFFRVGYPLVQLVSWCGGLLCCAATFALARLVGLGDRLSLLAALALLALPNVATQAFTSQTDLFTAGFVGTALACGLRGLRPDAGASRGDVRFAGLALGVAIGAKGTVFYLVPGLVGILAVAGAVWRVAPGRIARALALALAWAAPLAAPTYVRNVVFFGNPLAPRAELDRVHARPLDSRGRFAAVNALALGWQTLDPNSNLPVVREWLRPVFRRGAAALARVAAERPHFTGFTAAFEVHGRSLVRESRLHEDYASPGLLVPLLAGVGWVAAVRRRDPLDGGSRLLLPAMGLATLAFAAALALLQGWSAHKLRYFAVVGPFLALGAAGAFRGDGRARRVASGLAAAAFATMAATAFSTSRSHGLPALLHPESVAGAPEQRARERAIDELGFTGGRLGLALPYNSRVAPFLRRPAGHATVWLSPDDTARQGTFEEWLRDLRLDALVVDLDAMPRPAGRVRATWAAPDAAVALFRPGDPATGGLCSDAKGLDPGGTVAGTAAFRVYFVPGGRLELTLHNAAASARSVEVVSSLERRAERLAPNEARVVAIRVAAADDVLVRVDPGAAADRFRLGLPPGLSCASGPRTAFVRTARRRGV
jgi:hypothetical protein